MIRGMVEDQADLLATRKEFVAVVVEDKLIHVKEVVQEVLWGLHQQMA